MMKNILFTFYIKLFKNPEKNTIKLNSFNFETKFQIELKTKKFNLVFRRKQYEIGNREKMQ